MGRTRENNQLRRHWTTLGARDPLWAVLMKPGTKRGQWDPTQFLATGRAEVDGVVSHLGDLGIRISGVALDLGCGAGRTAQALRRHYDAVIGLDISHPMLAMARALDPGELVDFRHNEHDDLRGISSGSIDLVYSSLVLQHLPPGLAATMLSEIARVLRPGGGLAIQVCTEPLPGPKGWAFGHLPFPLLAAGQRLLLRYPAPMRMHPLTEEAVRGALEPRGVQVLDRLEDRSYGGHWTYHRYFGRRT